MRLQRVAWFLAIAPLTFRLVLGLGVEISELIGRESARNPTPCQ